MKKKKTFLLHLSVIYKIKIINSCKTVWYVDKKKY